MEIPDVFTLHHLEVLSWPFTSGRTSDLFLRRIRLPSLRSLTWNQGGNPTDDPFSLGIWTFFGNLSNAPLTTLSLHEVLSIDVALIKHIYHQNPRIENLILERCGGAIPVVLASLTPDWDGEEKTDEGSYLTRLKTLEVRQHAMNWDHPPKFENTIANFMIGRARGGFDSDFCLNLWYIGYLRWSHESYKKLQTLSSFGGRVQLLQDGERVSFL